MCLQALCGRDDFRGGTVLTLELRDARLELRSEGIHGWKSVLGVLLEGTVDRGRDAKREVTALVERVGRRLVHVLHGNGDEVVAGERKLAGQQLVEADAGGKNAGG